jgi:nucleoside-diphosphate-sugar epimerase
MNVFITGGTGYIGAHLIKELISNGHKVHALVRSLEKAAPLPKEGLVLFKGDLSDKESIKEAMKGCDQVYHMAGNTSIWEKDRSKYYTINVDGTRNIMDAALEHKVKRVVFTSTAGVLGPSYGGIVTELKCRNVDFIIEYESSKAMAESLIKSYVIEKNLDAVIVSPTRVFGPVLFGEPASITQLISKYTKGKWRIIPGDGSKIGNYVFVDDVVKGHILAMENGVKGGTYILGGENHSYNAFFKILKEESGLDYHLIKTNVGLQLFYAHLSEFFAMLRNKKPAITTKWVQRSNYHWEVSPNKAVEELKLKITPLREGIKKTLKSL